MVAAGSLLGSLPACPTNSLHLRKSSGFHLDSHQSFTPSTQDQLRYLNKIISTELNGDLGTDFAIRLAGAPALTTTNFLL